MVHEGGEIWDRPEKVTCLGFDMHVLLENVPGHFVYAEGDQRRGGRTRCQCGDASALGSELSHSRGRVDEVHM